MTLNEVLVWCLLGNLGATVNGISNTAYGVRKEAHGSYSYSIPGAVGHFRIGNSPRYDEGVGDSYSGNQPPAPSAFSDPVIHPDLNTDTPVIAAPVLSNDIGGVRVMNDHCRYYCRTPEKEIYCCEDDMDPINRPSVKSGRCPALVPCQQPLLIILCSNDSRCPDQDKCCFDPCLKRHACTAPSIN